MIYKEECYKIVGGCMGIYNELGYGLLEKVYQEAMEYEFKTQKIPYVREKKLDIHYKDIILPTKYYADFVVYKDLIVEIKSKREFHRKDVAQVIHYLNATKTKLGLLINFGEDELEHQRIIR